MIALTDRPEKVCEAILAKGGRPFTAPVAKRGTVVTDSRVG
jgi:hypothetical protein